MSDGGGFWVKLKNGDYVNLSQAYRLGVVFDAGSHKMGVVASFTDGSTVDTPFTAEHGDQAQQMLDFIVSRMNGDATERVLERVYEIAERFSPKPFVESEPEGIPRPPHEA